MSRENPIHLVLFSSDDVTLSKFAPLAASLPNLKVVKGGLPEAHAKSHFDAVWLPLMVAADWGASIPFPAHRGLAFRTPQNRLDRGMPGWFITGGVLRPGEKMSAVRGAKLILANFFEGAQSLMEIGAHRSLVIGSGLEMLLLDEISAAQAEACLRETFANSAERMSEDLRASA